MADETLSSEELLREVQELRAQAKEQDDRLLRALAELENQRKRGVREMDDARKFALHDFVYQILPVKDSLERGVEAVAPEARDEAEALREGIELTLREWDRVLANEGVEEIDPLGHPFNPEIHEALSVRHDPDAVPSTVLEVVQKGYLLNGRLVRPARVIVAARRDDSNSSAPARAIPQSEREDQ